jgi:hypothetical protein
MGHADRGAEIAQPVPDLDNHEQTDVADAEVHVDRVGRVGWSGWQLERAAPSVRLDQPKDELLAREMSRVRQFGLNRARESDRQRPPDRDAERNPRRCGDARAEATLDLCYPLAADADAPCEVFLRHAQPKPRSSNVATHGCRDGARLAVSDKEDARAPTCLPISSRHAGQIIYFGPYRSLMRVGRCGEPTAGTRPSTNHSLAGVPEGISSPNRPS